MLCQNLMLDSNKGLITSLMFHRGLPPGGHWEYWEKGFSTVTLQRRVIQYRNTVHPFRQQEYRWRKGVSDDKNETHEGMDTTCRVDSPCHKIRHHRIPTAFGLIFPYSSHFFVSSTIFWLLINLHNTIMTAITCHSAKIGDCGATIRGPCQGWP